MIPTKLIIYGVAVILTVLTAWGIYLHIDNNGYQRAAVEYQAKIDKVVADYKDAKSVEVERQDAVNDAAKAAEARDIAALQADNTALQAQLKEQAGEASNDPNAKRPALGPDSVRRLNAIH